MPLPEPKWDDRGLVPAVVQDADRGTVLMLAWMNHDAWRLTNETGIVHFWSRSRQALWKKGETSGHVLRVSEVRIDCDHDAVLVRARPDGPTCHTGATACFFHRGDADDDDGAPPSHIVDRLAAGRGVAVNFILADMLAPDWPPAARRWDNGSPRVAPTPAAGFALSGVVMALARDWFAARGWTPRAHQLDMLAKARAEVDAAFGNEMPRIEHLAKLRYIEQILMETLRIWPTAPAFALKPYEDTLLAGRYALRKWDTVMVLVPTVPTFCSSQVLSWLKLPFTSLAKAGPSALKVTSCAHARLLTSATATAGHAQRRRGGRSTRARSMSSWVRSSARSRCRSSFGMGLQRRLEA